MEEILDVLRKNDIILKPMNLFEIENIETKFRVKLPKSYKEFLLYMGKGADKFMLGSDVFFDSIFNLKEYANDLILDNAFLTLPDDAWVFWMHQGYQLAYFKLSEGDNPPVYYFSEGLGLLDFVKEESFEFFLKKQLIISDLLIDNVDT